jgi:hypothetical protein
MSLEPVIVIQSSQKRLDLARSGLAADGAKLEQLAHPVAGAVGERLEALCVAYALDDGPVKLWVPGTPVPNEFIAADPNTCFAAHNANFEFSIIQQLLAPRFGWPTIPIERFIAQWRGRALLRCQGRSTAPQPRWVLRCARMRPAPS